ncbi:GDSL-type esterase/lipase family protein [Marinilabiliaceae bacterium ANBcel2]|nr:GDSL-type esterase/lipase family protein [Marinilabiliaceae bacterium ANBcel2]
MKTVLCFYLLFFSITIFAQRPYERAHLWEDEVNAFLDKDKIDLPPENSVLFIGSSSFRAWTSLQEDFPDHYIINRGFGGSHLADVIRFFDKIVKPYKPSHIVVYEGDNDIASGLSPKEYLEDVITFVRLCEIFLPGVKIDFVSIKPSPAREEWTSNYIATNRLVREYAEKNSMVRLIDITQLMIDDQGQIIEDYFIEDMIHLNDKGYHLWRQVISPYLD